MDNLNKLTKIFCDFPGIGPRQAKRFVYFLLTRSDNYLNDLINLVSEIKKEIKICSQCFRYFPKNNSINNDCDLCRNLDRKLDTLMIVARDVDFENIEKSQSFFGKYFILGGTIPILDKTPEKRIRLKELLIAVENKAKVGLKEIILGLSANPDGEYTGQFITEALASLISKYGLKISHLGRGLSTGTELEYSDSDTIKSALENRK